LSKSYQQIVKKLVKILIRVGGEEEEKKEKKKKKEICSS
jgi:hypothetical protein